MYTSLINVQIIISLLKQYNIRSLVLSPGTRNTPFAHSVESDPFFTCYSIVDERSAAYFALGLAEALDEPVCVSCTSATATCNYMPAIKEAFDKRIPLIALTADRDYRFLYQMEDQMIDQIDMYKEYVLKSVNLPIVNDKNDISYCERIINSALILLKEKNGPIQINYQVYDIGKFNIINLPRYRKINVHTDMNSQEVQDIIVNSLKSKKRILVLCGQLNPNEHLNKELEAFSTNFGAVISYDYFSNLNSDRFIKTIMATEAMNIYEAKKYLPDLVITIGLHIWSNIKYLLRDLSGEFEHWRVALDGEINDGFKSLSNVFQCHPDYFFKYINSLGIKNNNDSKYYELWKKRIESVKLPDLKFTNFYAIYELSKLIPKESILHLSILNSIRMINFSNLQLPTLTYGNLGADGIDGALSTFLGQSSDNKSLSFLIIGDLSFLYDLNASTIRMHPNQRIMVINNFAGGEFHNNFGLDYIPTLNNYIAAGHKTKISEWVNAMDVIYYSASNREELALTLEKFLSESDKPILLEVFTNADTDSKVLKSFYSINSIAPKKRINTHIKKYIKSLLARFGISIARYK